MNFPADEFMLMVPSQPIQVIGALKILKACYDFRSINNEVAMRSF
jgi:hypothetical protein